MRRFDVVAGSATSKSMPKEFFTRHVTLLHALARLTGNRVKRWMFLNHGAACFVCRQPSRHHSPAYEHPMLPTALHFYVCVTGFRCHLALLPPMAMLCPFTRLQCDAALRWSSSFCFTLLLLCLLLQLPLQHPSADLERASNDGRVSGGHKLSSFAWLAPVKLPSPCMPLRTICRSSVFPTGQQHGDLSIETWNALVARQPALLRSMLLHAKVG